MSLFARINEDGKLTLVNHLGVDLGETPEQILQSWMMIASKMTMCVTMVVTPHDYDYVHRVRDGKADTPAL